MNSKTAAMIVSVAITVVQLGGEVRGQEEPAPPKQGAPISPERRSKRGDYDIEHYSVKRNDLIKIKMRGVYEVVGVEERHLLLKPLPPQRGLLPGVWKAPKGRCHIGNHHKMVVSHLDAKKQTAEISLEYKERWHWWDFNF